VNSSYQPIVSTRPGKLEGSYEGDLYVFRGIPYAAPPVGNLRWMPPEPVKPWREVRPAKKFGPIAPQNPMPAGMIMQVEQPQSEDCLFLNIWTPGLDNAKRPVMVWIHGGAFTIGSGSDPMYDSDKLPKRGNIVLVTINYRLGMLGFLRLKDVTSGKIPATGNEGFLDQVAALKWVKENIAAFGGDPENITVFGESAGSMSIACLMVMPAAKGLFQKAIMESGVGSVAVHLEKANQVGQHFLEVSGIAKDDINALRSLTPAQLLEMEMKLRVFAAGPGEVAKITATTPVADNEVIPDLPAKLAHKGAAKGIPAIIGSNLNEWTLFGIMQPGFAKITETDMMQRLTAIVPASAVKKLVEAYTAAFRQRGEPATPADIVTAISTDAMFRIPSLELVEAQRKNKTPVYNYLFTWQSPVMGGVLKACHALEIGFVFGKYDPMFCGSGPDADRLSECMQEAWLAFARTGDPSNKCTGAWSEYGTKRLTMVFGKESHIESAPYEKERAAWEAVKRYDTLVI